MFTRKFITICTFLLPLICTGKNIEIKLNCQMTLNVRTQTKDISVQHDKETMNIIFDVFQANSHLLISTDSPRISSVTTLRKDYIISINNTSDSNKWALNNIGKVKDMLNDTTITIDRNTGSVLYVQKITYADGRIDAEGQGSCKKIDTSKKLF